MRDVSGSFLIFQQDNVTAHRARDTVRFLEQSTPTFIRRDLWPQNSTDLSSVDYKINGATSSSEWISRSSTALTNRSSVCWTFGMDIRPASLSMQLTSDVSVFERVCEQKADIFLHFEQLL